MTDTLKTTIHESPEGEMGQKYLAAGNNVAMRLWVNEEPSQDKQDSIRDYETVGYVLKGRAVLHLEGKTIELQPGDSWLVPQGAIHHYDILEPFTAIEATSPPARQEGRDRV